MDAVVVVGALIRKDNKILLCQRAAQKSFAGLWEFPGGKLKLGESLQQALEREIFEELKIKIKAGFLIATCNFLVNSEKAEFFLLEAVWESGELTNFPTVDHDASKWVSFAELAQYALTEPDLKCLPKVFSQPDKASIDGVVFEGKSWEIKHLNPWSIAKLYAAINFLLGLLMACGILWLGTSFFQVPLAGVSKVWVAAILPIFYSFIGGTAGFLMASFYNMVAAIVGGIQGTNKP